MSDVATGSPDVCSMSRSCFEPRRDENSTDGPIALKPNPHAGRQGIRETVSRALETLRTCATSLNRSCHQGILRLWRLLVSGLIQHFEHEVDHSGCDGRIDQLHVRGVRELPVLGLAASVDQ